MWLLWILLCVLFIRNTAHLKMFEIFLEKVYENKIPGVPEKR